MKQGWEYKKLDSCAYIEYGTRVVQKKDGGTIYPVYGGGGETFRIDRFNREDCLIVARFAMSPLCVRYVKGKFFLNDSGLSVKAGKELYQSYLNHHIRSLNDKIYNLGKGAAQRNLDVKSFKNLQIGIPPKSTQLAIVSELDKINELIRLKKKQLKDFDNLAQSIFYEMFGDPVENEMGWEVKKLGKIGELARGVSKHRPRNAPELLGGKMPLIQTGDVANSDFYIRKYSSTYSDLGVAQSKVWEAGTLCITIAATIGKCAILSFTACFPDSVVGYKPNKDTNTIYMFFIFKNMQKMLEEFAPGVAQKNINLKILSGLNIPLPPLPLQHLFAQRIEQIEHQKAEVQKAITDLETLLASRMQYWFE